MKLPFSISKLWGLRGKSQGFALVGESGIQLVFRNMEEISSLPDGEADQFAIPWKNFAGMRVERGILGDKLRIEVHVILGKSPDGDGDNVIELEIPKGDQNVVEFQKQVEAYRTGKGIEQVDQVLDDVRDLLDRL